MIRAGDIVIDRKNRTISRDEASYRWHCKTARMIDFSLMQHLILSPGLAIHEIFDLLYGDDADGGPEVGVEIIRVMLCHMKPKLEKLNLRLVSTKNSGRMHYHVAR